MRSGLAFIVLVAWAWACACACTACGGAPAPAARPTAPRPLTPADVGLPEVPPEEPRAARGYVPTPPQPPTYYRREACPAVRGCQYSREITVDGVSARYSCRPGTGMRTYYALRKLEVVEISVEDIEGSLDRNVVRRALSRQYDTWKGCLDRAGHSAAIQIRGAISAAGAPMGAEVTGAAAPAAACIRESLAAATFPPATIATAYAVTADYEVTDPATVPPLDCQ